ncbi:unnamed protein product [Calypogeia fissa]
MASRSGYGGGEYAAALVSEIGKDTRRVLNLNFQAHLRNRMLAKGRVLVDSKVVQLQQELAKCKALLKTTRSKSGSIAVRSLPISKIDMEVQTDQSFPTEENVVFRVSRNTEGGANSGKEIMEQKMQLQLEQHEGFADAQHVEQMMAQDRYVMERQGKEIAEAKNKEHYDEQGHKIKKLESNHAKMTIQLAQVLKAQLGSRQTMAEELLGLNEPPTITELEGNKTRIRELEVDLESRKKREQKLNSDLAESQRSLGAASSELVDAWSKLVDANGKAGDLNRMVYGEEGLKIQLLKAQQELLSAKGSVARLQDETRDQANQLRGTKDLGTGL